MVTSFGLKVISDKVYFTNIITWFQSSFFFLLFFEKYLQNNCQTYTKIQREEIKVLGVSGYIVLYKYQYEYADTPNYYVIAQFSIPSTLYLLLLYYYYSIYVRCCSFYFYNFVAL